MISLYGQICMCWYDVVCIWVLAHYWQWNEETIQRYMAAKKLALISQIGLECILYYNLYMLLLNLYSVDVENVTELCLNFMVRYVFE